MKSTRREFLALSAAELALAGCGTGPAARTSAAAAPAQGIRALAFDAFPVLDPRPVARALARHAGERSHEVLALWRQRQFEYTWLRASADQFEDFWTVTADALRYAVRALGVTLGPDSQSAVMDTYRTLPPWPDAPQALTELRQQGLRLGFLSNFTSAMLHSSMAAGDLGGLLDDVVSTERARTYKPSPKAYQLAVDAFGLEPAQIGFVAFAPWDAAGAMWFGFPTFWINRAGVAPEELGPRPRELPDLAALARALG